MIVIAFICVMFLLYCTEITMFRFRCRSWISDYNKFFHAIYCYKNVYFLAYFSQLHFIFAIKWVGLDLRVLSLNCLLIK